MVRELEPATLPLQDFLHSARPSLIELRPPPKATWLPFKKAPTPGPRPGGRLRPSPSAPTPRGSAPRPRRGGLPATCPLPIPHTKRDRGAARADTGPAPRRPPAARPPGPSRLPSMHFQAPAISELQPRGQSGRKKQEVWDCPSRGPGVPNSRPCTRRYLALPRPQPLADFPGVRFGAGLSSKNPDVFVGHSGTFPGFPSL